MADLMRGDPPRTLELAFRPGAARRILLILLAAELTLVVFDTTLNYRQWLESRSLRRLFNIAREDSLANFLASVQSLTVGAIAVLIYLAARRQGAGRGWVVVAAFFLYQGLDDGARIHERVGTAFESTFAFVPSYTWQIVFVPIFAVGAAVTLALVWREAQAPARRWSAFAAVCCWGSAVFLDFLDGREGTEEAIADSLGLAIDDLSHYSKVTEEFLEAFGTSIFLVLFLLVLSSRVDTLRVTFREAKAGGAAEAAPPARSDSDG